MYGELAKHSLTEEQACLLQGSASRGAKATRKQELARALKRERAGLSVDPELGLLRLPNGSQPPHAGAGEGLSPPGDVLSQKIQPGVVTWPATDDTAADRQLQQETMTSDDSAGSEAPAADSAAEPSATKRQKLDEGAMRSCMTAGSGPAAPEPGDLRMALKQSRAELGLPGERSPPSPPSLPRLLALGKGILDPAS